VKAVRFLILAASLALAGCDGQAPPRPAFLRVEAVDAESGAPEAGVKLVLMDAAANRPLGVPAATGANGAAVFALPVAGRLQVLAFPGGGRGVFAPAPPVAPADSAARRGWWSASPETLRTRLLTWRAPAFADHLPRISGRVVDASSGEPLAGAFLGLADRARLGTYAGEVSVREDVTDADGRFHVAAIPFGLDDQTGRIVQVLPLLVTRAGYAPAAWRYDPPAGDDNLDIAGVEIALAPAAAGGALSGRVVFADRPVPDVAVGLAFGAPLPPGAKAALVPSQVARTDRNGRFAIGGLAPGVYAVQPGYGAGDGWVAMAVGLNVVVSAGGETDAGDQPVCREITTLRPRPGEVLADSLPRLSWTAVAEADSYGVFLDGRYLGAGVAPAWTPPPGSPLPPGPHELEIVAFTRDLRLLGWSEGRVRFLVATPPPAR